MSALYLTLYSSEEFSLQLTENPVRFDSVSQVTNVFFDDTNGQVFTVRSGGVTGVTVSGLDETASTSFRMEDKGPIVSIKFSPDQKLLAIQRNCENQDASVDFMNFKDLSPTNVEYSHTCKWKNAKILGFVWPKNQEIAFITDHGIELLQVLPERKQLKSLKNTTFSAAWFSWCAQSKIVLLAGNNGALLQPFSLNNSTITKLQKLEMDLGKPIAERDVSIIRVNGTTWCALLKHSTSTITPGPAEWLLLPVTGPTGLHHPHILKTGLTGRFAINIVDDMIVVHHQASQTSLLFDIMENSKLENGIIAHLPVAPRKTMKPFVLHNQLCPMYSGNWVVLQPDYIIDARLGCLWKVTLNLSGLVHSVPKEEVPKIVSVLLRRSQGKETVYNILNHLIIDGGNYLAELSLVFDEINSLYRKWIDLEILRQTGVSVNQHCDIVKPSVNLDGVINQSEIYSNVFQVHTEDKYLVQVLTVYVASLCKYDIVIQHSIVEMYATTLVRRGQCNRLQQSIRQGCLGDSRPLACLLLSLGNLDPAAAQLALDMMWRLKAFEEIVEVLLSCHDPIAAVGAAKQSSSAVWQTMPARKILAVAKQCAESNNDPGVFTAIYHALENRNRQLRGSSQFLKGEQCDSYIDYYKKVTAD